MENFPPSSLFVKGIRRLSVIQQVHAPFGSKWEMDHCTCWHFLFSKCFLHCSLSLLLLDARCLKLGRMHIGAGKKNRCWIKGYADCVPSQSSSLHLLINSGCVKERLLRGAAAASKPMLTLQKECEILIKPLCLWSVPLSATKVGVVLLSAARSHSLPAPSSHSLSKWQIRNLVFTPSEVWQWKAIDYKCLCGDWFTDGGVK